MRIVSIPFVLLIIFIAMAIFAPGVWSMVGFIGIGAVLFFGAVLPIIAVIIMLAYNIVFH